MSLGFPDFLYCPLPFFSRTSGFFFRFFLPPPYQLFPLHESPMVTRCSDARHKPFRHFCNSAPSIPSPFLPDPFPSLLLFKSISTSIGEIFPLLCSFNLDSYSCSNLSFCPFKSSARIPPSTNASDSSFAAGLPLFPPLRIFVFGIPFSPRSFFPFHRRPSTKVF